MICNPLHPSTILQVALAGCPIHPAHHTTSLPPFMTKNPRVGKTRIRAEERRGTRRGTKQKRRLQKDLSVQYRIEQKGKGGNLASRDPLGQIQALPKDSR